MRLIYNHKLKNRSRDLRNSSTLSEVILWTHLKQKKFGYQFLRQKPIGNYIVDFYCPRSRLVIGIDGLSHQGREQYDKFRDEYLSSLGLRTIRFLDSDVKNNLDAVLLRIKDKMNSAIIPL